MSQMGFWSFIEEELLNHRPVVLLLVIAHEGSTPGRTGFKMAVAQDGRLCGSIGGGAVEYDLVESIKEQLQSAGVKLNIQRLLHDDGASMATSGMICGGSQTVLTFPCDSRHLEAVQQIKKGITANQPSLMRITGQDLHWSAEIGEDSSSIYEEKLGYEDTVYIIGGGHVASALSLILSTLDVRIVILDDRPELDALKKNAYAHDIIIAPMEKVASFVPPGEHCYVVIMTPSHRADEVVLRQLISHSYRYLGLMASRAKAAQILANLRNEGVPESALQKVRTPIGLPIHSHTPPEIAVSIAAEIIHVRNDS